MMRTISIRMILAICLLAAMPLAALAQDAAPAQEGAADQSEAPAATQEEGAKYTVNFAEVMPRIAASENCQDLSKNIEDVLRGCKTFDDYDKLALEIKSIRDEEGRKCQDVLCYELANIRYNQLSYLSRSNDIDAGRLYLSINDAYYSEALENLEKAKASAGSSDSALEVMFLEYVIYKEKLQANKTNEIFNDMIKALASYSADPFANKAKLSYMAGKFKAAGMADEGIKLRTSYASTVDKAAAQGIFDDIRIEADQNFAKGDMREATALYEQYTSLAGSYYAEEELAPTVMDIAEKYFSAGKYKEARRYYELYMQRFGTSNVVDYASYKIALCFYNEHDHAKAISQLEKFINAYQNSIWYDKAFEVLCRLYFENFPKEKAVEGLQHLIDKYYRKNVGDYAQVLIGYLNYLDKEYDAASKRFKKVEPTSPYYYISGLLLEDIKKIKGGSLPQYGSRPEDSYRMWDPGKTPEPKLVIGDKKPGTQGAGDGAQGTEVKPGSSIKISLDTSDDQDTFQLYVQDKDDASRLPKKIGEETEKDLIALQWSCEGGKFVDEKQGGLKAWQAPSEAGTYKISARTEDFGLVRIPDKGIRKDPVKDTSIVIVVKE